ncbi:MAG: protein TolR [Gammaproteobacteria bacterium]|jgi:biopolymer transport protein TolR|nr:protein TolR [Gammaproteobacteria bacterium]MBT3867309.1 protein TolR [Gammaproteobacteria bacterium]MBT4378036.1 protein TolR [Gammaproteobacteria bacterium]MBT4617402.1 protein TolR [Gammaproteobacteria bacterium]MBT5198796.1 protein TolR [Gammaproteobacteria bacterium]|tara:strand:- start:141 stop:563 length:423 start_codon:yes stop_codon:yes gene_type:complete
MSKAARRKPMSEINVVPYIDVMLVLLVIFMVTAPLMTQGIKVDLPEAASGPIDVTDDEPMLVVSVKHDTTYYINLGEAEEPVSLSEIGDKAARIIAANPGIKVLVEGDKKLAYGVIVDLMNTLQAAGAKSVGLITEPPRT